MELRASRGSRSEKWPLPRPQNPKVLLVGITMSSLKSVASMLANGNYEVQILQETASRIALLKKQYRGLDVFMLDDKISNQEMHAFFECIRNAKNIVIFLTTTGESANVGKSSSLKATIEDGEVKKRLRWTEELDNKFVEAISVLGERRANPKSIIKYMGEPNITPRQISSHLQKHRERVKRSWKYETSNSSQMIHPMGHQKFQPNVLNSLTNFKTPSVNLNDFGSFENSYSNTRINNNNRGARGVLREDMDWDLFGLRQEDGSSNNNVNNQFNIFESQGNNNAENDQNRQMIYDDGLAQGENSMMVENIINYVASLGRRDDATPTVDKNIIYSEAGVGQGNNMSTTFDEAGFGQRSNMGTKVNENVVYNEAGLGQWKNMSTAGNENIIYEEAGLGQGNNMSTAVNENVNYNENGLGQWNNMSTMFDENIIYDDEAGFGQRSNMGTKANENVVYNEAGLGQWNNMSTAGNENIIYEEAGLGQGNNNMGTTFDENIIYNEASLGQWNNMSATGDENIIYNEAGFGQGNNNISTMFDENVIYNEAGFGQGNNNMNTNENGIYNEAGLDQWNNMSTTGDENIIYNEAGFGQENNMVDDDFFNISFDDIIQGWEIGHPSNEESGDQEMAPIFNGGDSASRLENVEENVGMDIMDELDDAFDPEKIDELSKWLGTLDDEEASQGSG